MATWSNCFIHAVSRWVTRGGWLIMRRSHAGPYPHFIHADYLPEDLHVSHFVADQKASFWRVLFRGHVQYHVGDVKPPEVSGWFDVALFAFWYLYFAGLIALAFLAVDFFTR